VTFFTGSDIFTLFHVDTLVTCTLFNFVFVKFLEFVDVVIVLFKVLRYKCVLLKRRVQLFMELLYALLYLFCFLILKFFLRFLILLYNIHELLESLHILLVLLICCFKGILLFRGGI